MHRHVLQERIPNQSLIPGQARQSSTHELQADDGAKRVALSDEGLLVLKYDSSVVMELRVGDQEDVLDAEGEEVEDELDLEEDVEAVDGLRDTVGWWK